MCVHLYFYISTFLYLSPYVPVKNTVALFEYVSVHVSACSHMHVCVDKQHIKIQVIFPPTGTALSNRLSFHCSIKTQLLVPQSPLKG